MSDLSQNACIGTGGSLPLHLNNSSEACIDTGVSTKKQSDNQFAENGEDPQTIIAELRRQMEAQTEQLKGLKEANSRLLMKERIASLTDNRLEECMRNNESIRRTIIYLCEMLCGELNCEAVFVRTYNEQLTLDNFKFTVTTSEFDWDNINDICLVTDNRERYLHVNEQGTCLAQHIDVAGEIFGSAGCYFARPLSESEIDLAYYGLDAWLEVLDNHLFSTAQMRRKHKFENLLSKAMRKPIFDNSIDESLQVVREHVDFDEMALVIILDLHELTNTHKASRHKVHYRVLKDGKITSSSSALDLNTEEFHEEVIKHSNSIIKYRNPSFLIDTSTRFELAQVKLNGIEQSVIGRAFFVREKVFTIFDMEILDRFADHVTQRVWDFSREWKSLSMSFPGELVRRLLLHENYVHRYLLPKERLASVLFVDISGFTHLCETIIKEPVRIGELVDKWSEGVVDIIWETGGVFDKMVGDCVIGLWGPPFFEISPTEMCLQAIHAALRIKSFSSKILAKGEGEQGEEPIEIPLRVTIGINFCRLCAGLFGPNEAYTAFSSGMNSAARLQACAGPGQILCMKSVCDVVLKSDQTHPLMTGIQFGPQRGEWVKNVSQPIQFCQLIEDESEDVNAKAVGNEEVVATVSCEL
eukprot:TRINITY_DN10030_c0_g1_i1.p1 TRINITY_DN10030_c0_g1~~TRINITY_DN10030_c0_g1_i1.p1  ORF type:complete len:641 (+),score=145.65 TRINITY_DN10030_c0_g1_i1:34-1956(+)